MTTPAPYLVIADKLRAMITGGTDRADDRMATGERLPSVAALAEEHGVSPSVVARAYKVLADEGLVIGRPGDGTYVRAPAGADVLIFRNRPDSTSSPFATGAAEQGVLGTWASESASASATSTIARRLGIAEGAPVMRTNYTYKADGEPALLATSWEPLSITGDSLIVLPELGPHAGLGVAARMRMIGITVTEPAERTTARPATRAEAAQLGISPSSPVLAIERTYYDAATWRPVETADLVLIGFRWVTEHGPRPPALHHR